MSAFEYCKKLITIIIGITLSIATLACQEGMHRDQILSISAAKKQTIPQPLYVRLPSALMTPEFIARTRFNRDHVRDDVFAFGYLPQTALEALSDREFHNLLELDAKAWAHHDFDAKTLAIHRPAALDAPDVVEAYHDYNALTDELTTLSQTFPNLAVLASAGRSVEGRELWYLRISDHANSDVDEHEPKMLYVANMHGDETVGRELMIYLARQLLTAYGTDPKVTNLVNHAEIFIMPSMNPDGFEAESRFNAHGVDLNRNFPDFTADPDDSTTNREPETQALMSLHHQHDFILALNFHGGSLCFNLPWDTQANRGDQLFLDDAFMHAAGRRYIDLHTTMAQTDGDSFDRGLTYGYEWYEVDGGLQDYANYYHSSLHATVELSQLKWPNARALPRFWQENAASLVDYLEQGLSGAFFQIQGSDGLAPSSVELKSNERILNYHGAYIQRPLLAGPATLSISAPGYQMQTVEVAARPFAGHFETVILQKN